MFKRKKKAGHVIRTSVISRYKARGDDPGRHVQLAGGGVSRSLCQRSHGADQRRLFCKCVNIRYLSDKFSIISECH